METNLPGNAGVCATCGTIGPVGDGRRGDRVELALWVCLGFPGIVAMGTVIFADCGLSVAAGWGATTALWVFCVCPAIIWSCWSRCDRERRCGVCGGRIVPVTTPFGRRLADDAACQGETERRDAVAQEAVAVARDLRRRAMAEK